MGKHIRSGKVGYKDETGNVYGLLTVLGPSETPGSFSKLWRCRCECGTEIEVYGTQLRNGGKRSCGCLRRMPMAERSSRGLLRGRT